MNIETLAEEQAETLTRRTRFIQALRDCADMLEQHSDIPAPYNGTLNAFVSTKDEVLAAARAGGGLWTKGFSDNQFWLSRAFGKASDETYAPLSFEVNCSRETVCQKIKTGTRIVPAREEREEEVFEWRCEDTLLLGEK